ncbi:MAG: hypothetical protein CEO19_399 [Parcubacteria group bacterium Gr01-1014_73]|nr:MAG: hypothetical protein CEO19_399 [Parcubacteria group bacterium Gr01-1014_73]
MKKALLRVSRELVQNGKTVGMIVEWENIYGWGPRIGARIIKEIVMIKRKYGPIGEGEVWLSLDELVALNNLCQYWKSNREDWAAFCFRVGGFPMGGGHWIFQVPGKDSKSINVGHESMVSSGGERFKNKNTVKPLDAPKVLSTGINQVAELWRFGEKFGNADGEKVGEVYQIGNKEVELKRYDLIIRCANSWAALEPNYEEEEFIHELVELVKNLA